MNIPLENKILSPDGLMAQLRKASAYTHSVEGPVVVHETHISWVFLAGHFAYKIKKPITTDFLDYGSLEKRHHACCEELRLDSRFADGLYLDVVPITVEDGMVRMDGDSQPIEFALRMRRFPDGSLLSQRIEAGQVTVDHMIQLATTIAGFHRRAAVARDHIDEALLDIDEQSKANFDYLNGEPLLDREQMLRPIESWANQFFVQHQGLFRRRMREGFVRECHGDLHCDNIVYWHEHFVPFDGIEFNPKYSWIDVLSDVSFLIMDLRYREHPKLAACFLNAYLEQTGDYEYLPLLRWYAVYRALVRAKVAVMRMRQASLETDRFNDQLSAARGYLKIAAQLIQFNSRFLMITHGVSGSGKTTGSQRIVEAEDAIRVRSDVERKRLFGKSMVSPSAVGVGKGMYSTTATMATYQVLQMLARKILEAGYSVVVDATFLKFADRQQFQALAESEKAAFRILDFKVDEATLRQRIQHRRLTSNDASDADIQVLQRQLTEQEPLTDSEAASVVDANRSSLFPIL